MCQPPPFTHLAVLFIYEEELSFVFNEWWWQWASVTLKSKHRRRIELEAKGRGVGFGDRILAAQAVLPWSF